MEEIEQINSGVEESGSSPEPQTSSVSENSSNESAVTKEAAPSEQKQDTEKEPPFNEHPRFKELIEQRNQERTAREALEKRMAAYEEQLNGLKPKQEAPKDAVMEKLMDIDPEFAKYIGSIKQDAAAAQELKAWRQAQESEQIRLRAVDYVNQQHEANKLSPELRERYNRELDAMISLRQAREQDLPNLYKEVHEGYTKLLEGYKRSVTESYVKSKAADAKTPAPVPKGKAVNPAKSFEYSKDPETARAQMVSRIIKRSKAENSI